MQLLELKANVIIGLNMMDLAKEKGIDIDIESLSKELGVKVIPITATKESEIQELLEEISKNYKAKNSNIRYSKLLEDSVEEICKKLKSDEKKSDRWIGIKLLEEDNYIKKFAEIEENKEVAATIEVENNKVLENLGFPPDMAFVNERYDISCNIVKKSVKRKEDNKTTITERIDKVVTHKIFGLPIFAAIMYLLYETTFVVGGFLQETFDGLIGTLAESTLTYLEKFNLPNIIYTIIGDGVFGGVGAVVAFLPLITVMYLLIGVLEDTGYMARAAYVMDRIMRKLGLHGKTFVSMIVSIGCNVPGIMATRTLDNKKDRMIGILINPFISCGARLPIYALFISTFFEKDRGFILFLIYTLGIIVALVMGKIFSKTLFKGETSYFIMELPEYKLPSLKNMLLLMWDKAGAFLKKAGIVIFPMMIVLSILANFPVGVEPNSKESLLGAIGTFIAPIFNLAGFGNWQAAIALLTGILAKETVVGTMGMVYTGVEEGALVTAAIASAFTPLSAVSFMVMSLLYTPCLVALGAIKRETNSWKWTAFTAIYTFVVAWVVSVLIYQIGSLLGF